MSEYSAHGLPLAGAAWQGSASARIQSGGRSLINFYGAGYLALNSLPVIRQAVFNALQEGVAFSRQIAGCGAIDPYFAEVELAGAELFGTEDSVYLPTGYFIGTAGIAALAKTGGVALLDEFAHYNLNDAARLSGLETFTYPHCSTEAVRDILTKQARKGQRPVLLTDGAFATTGRIPPLAEYARELAAHDGKIYVDESHAVGVVGKTGRGAAEHCGLPSGMVAGGTLTKAFCAQGAVVGCSSDVAAKVRSTPQIGGSNQGSPLSAVASAAAIKYAKEHPEVRETVQSLANYLRKKLRALGIDCLDTPAAIVAFRVGGLSDMAILRARAFREGIHLHHSRYIGAGPNGIIRCAIFRDHLQEDIDALVELVKRI